MEEAFFSIAKDAPIIGILMYWVWSEKAERRELSAYCREQNQRFLMLLAKLAGQTSVSDILDQ